MDIHKIDNFFSKEELKELTDLINNSDDQKKFEELGRFQINFVLPNHLYKKISGMIQKMYDNNVVISSAMYVEYNSKYGEPNLRPHYDGDFNDVIIDFQLESNTVWPLGLDLGVYELKDNSALIFNPNQYAHWRPKKIFKNGEYVKMIFIRLANPIQKSNYSHLRYHPSNDIFKEIRKYRDSLGVL
jgi:hypothetical protein